MGVAGPYNIGARDGHTYFYKLEPSEALIRGYSLCLAARDVYLKIATSIADPIQKLDAEAQAAACDLVVQTVSDGANAIATTTAVEAEHAAKAILDAKQLRPDPPGKAFGIRLKDAIVARPIITGLGTLEVGVGDVAELDAAVGDSDGQPYWMAQEFGSAHNVGRRIKGLFEPGDSAPSQSMFREHPVFDVGVPGSRPMLIQRPIPAKGFLRGAGATAESFRSSEFRTVEQAAVRELKLIQTGNHPALKAIRRVVR